MPLFGMTSAHTWGAVIVICRKCGVAYDPTHLQRCWFCDQPHSDEERDHIDRPPARSRADRTEASHEAAASGPPDDSRSTTALPTTTPSDTSAAARA
jgi:hypothetical protein